MTDLVMKIVIDGDKYEQLKLDALHWSKNNFLRAETSQWRLL